MWDRSTRKEFRKYARRHWKSDWHSHRRGWFFVRMLFLFGFLTLLGLIGFSIVTFLVSAFVERGAALDALTWLGGLLVLILVISVFGWVGKRAYTGLASPLADLVEASREVAKGNFSTRIGTPSAGELRNLVNAFNQMAEQLQIADQQRKNMSADIAHELRNPIHIMQGNLEGMLDGVLEINRDRIEALLDETQLLNRLVEDLRTLTLAESGQLNLVYQSVDLFELMTDILINFSGQAEQAGVDLSLWVKEDQKEGFVRYEADGNQIPFLQLRIDVDRFQQAIHNLIANALRYTPTGGMIILRAYSIGDHRACVEVEDNGAGIDENDLPYIFDRFWKGDAARTHAQGVGSGLGLAITRQLIEAHGGIIEVNSRLGEGTRFIIEIPIGN